MPAKCGKIVRSPWMDSPWGQSHFVDTCQRPSGHRGDCGYSQTPPAPLRPVRLNGKLATTVPAMSTQEALEILADQGIHLSQAVS